MAQVVVSTMAPLFPRQWSQVAPGHSGAFAHQIDSGWANSFHSSLKQQKWG